MIENVLKCELHRTGEGGGAKDIRLRWMDRGQASWLRVGEKSEELKGRRLWWRKISQVESRMGMNTGCTVKKVLLNDCRLDFLKNSLLPWWYLYLHNECSEHVFPLVSSLYQAEPTLQHSITICVYCNSDRSTYYLAAHQRGPRLLRCRWSLCGSRAAPGASWRDRIHQPWKDSDVQAASPYSVKITTVIQDFPVAKAPSSGCPYTWFSIGILSLLIQYKTVSILLTEIYIPFYTGSPGLVY